MPKARKRKVPVTRNRGSASSNPHSSRALIRRFHCLLKRRVRLQSQPPAAQNVQSLADVEQELERLGGLAAYQRMSTIGQGSDRGGGSEKKLISWLTEMGMSNRSGLSKLRLLEVGALKPDNYRSCSSWIESTPIDLRSRHPSILKQDFLLMDPAEHFEKWDIISLSLVLNFTPEARDRGRMLKLTYDMLSREGLLFLVLPLPCVENSRYITFDHLEALMGAIGFAQVKELWKRGGKMVYWLYRKAEKHANDSLGEFERKTVFRQGNRNNFCIRL